MKMMNMTGTGATRIGIGRSVARLFLTILLAVAALPGNLAASPPGPVYLPLVAASGAACQPIWSETYEAIPVDPPPTDRPAEQHADLNLALRGYVPTDGYLGLVDYGGTADPRAPQLPGLFADQRTATFASVHQVHDWNWSCNCRGDPIVTPVVTLARLAVDRGEILYVPDSGYTIGSGHEVLVLYATPERVTLKYTRNDNVVHGYTLHLEGICVEPRLMALYQAWNQAGRSLLPALQAGQAIGRARAGTVGAAIRDSGTFLDPRSRKDWWQGRAAESMEEP